MKPTILYVDMAICFLLLVIITLVIILILGKLSETKRSRILQKYAPRENEKPGISLILLAVCLGLIIILLLFQIKILAGL